MASPHVAGTVALIGRSRRAARRRRPTETLLDQTATDVNNTTCGGTAADNNVWGEGKLNALAAVTAAPTGPDRDALGNGPARRHHERDRRRGGSRDRPGQPRCRYEPDGPVLDAPAGRHVRGHGHRSRLRDPDRHSSVTVSDARRPRRTSTSRPIPALEHELTTLTDRNGNGKIEPGETFAIDEELINTGHASATGSRRSLSSTTPGINITQANSAYPDIGEGATGRTRRLHRHRNERPSVETPHPAAPDGDD